MILPNGNIAYDRYSCEEYLSSLGMNKWDIQDFIDLLQTIDFVDWKQEAKEWELDSMQQFDKRNGLICDLQEVIDDLRAGKGTKAKIADRIEALCEYWY